MGGAKRPSSAAPVSNKAAARKANLAKAVALHGVTPAIRAGEARARVWGSVRTHMVLGAAFGGPTPFSASAAAELSAATPASSPISAAATAAASGGRLGVAVERGQLQ